MSARVALDVAGLCIGEPKSQKVILQPLYDPDVDKVKPLTWTSIEIEVMAADRNKTIWKNVTLRRMATYRPKVVIQGGSHSQDHECVDMDFTTSFWPCKNASEKIPSIGVCNGTNWNGTSDCSDGSDETRALCQGRHEERDYILAGLSIYQFSGILAFLLGELQQKYILKVPTFSFSIP